MLVGAYLKRGELYNLRGQCDRAAVDFSSAVDLDPRFDPAYHNLAYTRAGQGIFDNENIGGALQNINKAVDLNSRQAGYLYTRAQIYAELGRTDQAVTDADAAIRFATEDEEGIKSGAQDLKSALESGEEMHPFEPCRPR